MYYLVEMCRSSFGITNIELSGVCESNEKGSCESTKVVNTARLINT